MENINTLTLGEIVKLNYQAAVVFEKFGLDFCCMGNQNFNDACVERKVDPSQVVQALEEIHIERDDDVNFDSLPLGLLADHIYKRHHAYVEEKSPVLNAYLDKIYRVHGARHPELLEIKSIFAEISGELAVHMKKEEFLLFPFIKKLEQARASKKAVTSALFGSVNNPIALMKADHSEEGKKFSRINILTNNYHLPDDACSTFTAAYKLLEEFEKDLHVHIHLENNILFEKAIRLEAEVNSMT